MKTKAILIMLAVLAGCSLWAQEISITEMKYSGPYEVKKPFMEDTLDLNMKGFNDKSLLKYEIPLTQAIEKGSVLSASAGEITIPGNSAQYGLHLLSFYLNPDNYGEGTLTVEGLENAEVYVGGKLQNGSGSNYKLTLEPKSYRVDLKILTTTSSPKSIKATFKPSKDNIAVRTFTDNTRQYTLSDVFDGKRIQSASISPDGKYIIINYLETIPGGQTASYTDLVERANNSLIMRREGSANNIRWMPKSTKAYYIRNGVKGREMLTIDPATKEEMVIATNLPQGNPRWSPTEDFLIFSIQEKGPAEGKDLQQVLVPDDRQPGWRDRSFLHKYDLKTGLLERLTFGYLSTSAQDISPDGRYLLFGSSEPNLTERPFRRSNLYMMDLQTGEVEQLFSRAKYLGRASFSPTGKELLFSSSPEAFDGIGMDVLPNQIPSTSDGQLFKYNLESKQVTPLTKYFNPSIDMAVWNHFDNTIYAMAKDKDLVKLYSIDPAKGTINQLQCSEDVVSAMSLAANAPALLYYGLSASNSQRLYVQDTRRKNEVCLVDLSKEVLKDVKLGEVKDWNFISSNGDTIYGRYYLPPNFDPNKKYPMIVNYYGGVTPTARVLESRYPSHVYAGMDFVVYIVQPSGATGFGQEFAARHVNTWGIRTADDIIEGTKKFCDEHSFVNRDKIGCMGASYGGFMTMLLQTKTDIFAAAMSHAGISDITGYWGEGYWGYSYSETAAAHSYPWNNKELYVGQSPLYSADKFHAPLLLLHGAVDTNVPISESIQMFTALKLLGKEVAFVRVEGENHQIFHYDKRIQWNNSIYAWFYKWLKDDSSWWDALYPPKNL